MMVLYNLFFLQIYHFNRYDGIVNKY